MIGSRDTAGGQGPWTWIMDRIAKENVWSAVLVQVRGERGQRGTKAAVVLDRDDGWNSDFLWLFY